MKKFQWPPKRPEDENPMLTGPTATPIYINPMEPSPFEKKPTPEPEPAVGRVLIAPVKAPKPLAPVHVERGPPVYLEPLPRSLERPVSPMIYALTTAPTQPYNLAIHQKQSQQSQISSLASLTHISSHIKDYHSYPHFTTNPRPYLAEKHPLSKSYQSVQPPKPVTPQKNKPITHQETQKLLEQRQTQCEEYAKSADSQERSTLGQCQEQCQVARREQELKLAEHKELSQYREHTNIMQLQEQVKLLQQQEQSKLSQFREQTKSTQQYHEQYKSTQYQEQTKSVSQHQEQIRFVTHEKSIPAQVSNYDYMQIHSDCTTPSELAHYLPQTPSPMPTYSPFPA